MVAYGAFPAVFDGGSIAIKGEVYEVDEGILDYCDSLEGHPLWYKRILVESDNFGKVWMYCMHAHHIHKDMPMIETGEWNGLR